MLTPLAWAFTRKWLLGVWRCPEERRRSNRVHVFFFCLFSSTLGLNKQYDLLTKNVTIMNKKHNLKTSQI